MSLANEASLLLIPSGYKSGKVYSVFPTDGDGDFTFSRGSDGTRKGAGGLIETMSSNTPRLDYSNSDCPSLLLQPQRTNLLTYSQQLSQWTKQNLTITDNDAISPEGILTASKVLETAANSFHFAYNGVISAISLTDYSYSIFVKKLGRQYVGIQTLFNTAKGAIALFDLDNGSLVYTFQQGGHTVNNANIENYANDWYKISATFQVNDSTAVFGLVTANELWTSGTAYNNTYLGDITKGVYAFGGQVEQGSYPTSYIKTTGGIVTRLKDFIDGAGSSSLFNSLESTFFVEMASFLNAQTNSNGIELADISGQNRITLQYDTINNQIRCDVRVLNIAQAIAATQSFDVTNFNKMAITYKLNEVKFYVNGYLVLTDTSVNLFAPNTLTEVRSTIAGISGGAFNLQAKIKDLRVYDRVLTQAEAIQLTTL